MLALELGWDPDRVFAQTPEWFTKWQMFFKKQPFGHRVTQQMVAQLIAMTYNVNRSAGNAALTTEDFMPAFGVLQDDESDGETDDSDPDLLRQQSAYMAHRDRALMEQIEKETDIKFTRPEDSQQKKRIPQPQFRKPGQGLPKLGSRKPGASRKLNMPKPKD